VSRFFEDGELYQNHMGQNPPLPRVVQLELTADCNLKCVFCPLQSEPRERTGADRRISLEDLQTVLRPLLTNAYEVELTGFGEIFCHPQLIEALRYFKSLNLSVNATSNGSLWQADLLQTIVEEKLIDVLCVSLDAGRPATYAALRVGGDFEKVIEHLRTLHRIKTEFKTNLPELHLSFLTVKQNLHELNDVIDIAAQVGATQIIVQGLYENKAMKLQSTAYEKDELAFFSQAAIHAAQCGVEMELWYQSQPTVTENDSVQRAQVTGLHAAGRPMIKACPYPWERVFVKSNLDVQVCATVWEKLVMGNLREQTIEQIWHGEAYRSLRRRLAGTDPPPECIPCNTKPWQAPHTIGELTPSITFGEAKTGQLGQGFYDVERDTNNRRFRWTTGHSTLFMRNDGRPFLDLELYTHPGMPPGMITLRVNEMEIDRFRSDQIHRVPMRFALPEIQADVLQIDLLFSRTSTPREMKDGASRRPLGAMVVRAELSGDAYVLSDCIRIGKNCDAHLGRGFHEIEPGHKKAIRWTGDRASFLIAHERGDYLEFELWSIGKPRKQRVTIFIDGRKTTTVELPDLSGRILPRVPLPTGRQRHLIAIECESLYAPGGADTRHLGVLFAGARVVSGAKRSWWRRR